MQLIDNFFIDSENRVRLHTHKLIIRQYTGVDKVKYDDITLYLNDADYNEWMTQLIPKHKLNELVSDSELDTSMYEWMDGIRLHTDNPWKEIEEIAACGSLEAYEATLPESRDAFEVETDYRLSMLELGL